MKSLFGLTGIQVRAFEISHEDMSAVNDFLREYDGNVIDVQVVPMAMGLSKVVVVYKAVE